MYNWITLLNAWNTALYYIIINKLYINKNKFKKQIFLPNFTTIIIILKVHGLYTNIKYKRVEKMQESHSSSIPSQL